jgi:hypothetical protein
VPPPFGVTAVASSSLAAVPHLLTEGGILWSGSALTMPLRSDRSHAKATVRRPTTTAEGTAGAGRSSRPQSSDETTTSATTAEATQPPPTTSSPRTKAEPTHGTTSSPHAAAATAPSKTSPHRNRSGKHEQGSPDEHCLTPTFLSSAIPDPAPSLRETNVDRSPAQENGEASWSA